MKTAALDEIQSVPNPLRVHEIRKPISKVVGTTEFAMNYFELTMGESFSGGIHTHHDQEEVFFIMEGTATFEVGRKGDEEVRVGPEEAIRFAPGEYQCGYNRDEKAVVGLAIGAPDAMHEWDELESIVYCPECEKETGHGVSLENGRFELTCGACDYEH